MAIMGGAHPEHDQDDRCIGLCLELAQEAESLGEVPIASVVGYNGRIVATAHNQTILDRDPSAHAEILALRRAARILGNHRLPACRLYVGLEPCIMCAGAIIQARVDRLVYACDDPRYGAFSGKTSILDSHRHNHPLQIRRGVRADAARSILQDFFAKKRR